MAKPKHPKTEPTITPTSGEAVAKDRSIDRHAAPIVGDGRTRLTDEER